MGSHLLRRSPREVVVEGGVAGGAVGGDDGHDRADVGADEEEEVSFLMGACLLKSSG